MAIKQYSPLHPGEFIKRVYLEPFNIGTNELARSLKVSPSTLSRLLNGKSDVSPEMALKLARVIGRSPESWMMMQNNFDLHVASQRINLDDLVSISFAT